jgi:hypothetical protein
MVTAIDAAFQRWGLMISVGKTKAMRIHGPLPGEERAPLPVVFVGDQRIETVRKFKYLGQIVSEDGQMKDEITRRIGLACRPSKHQQKGYLAR